MLVKLLNTLLMVVVALSITGVINRTRALLAGRKGIRFFQHIYNVRLQLQKGAVYSTTTTALFRIAPAVYLGGALLAFLFIPVADLEPMLSFHGDIILVAYLLALSRVAIILAALDTGSSFEGMGAAREALYGALVEPALMMGLATLALFCGYSSFADIFSMAQELDMNLPIAGWLKNAIFAVIAANAIAVAVSFHWWFAVPMAIIITGVSIGVVESLRARNKLSRNITYILTIVAMSALVLLTGFLLIQNIEI